MFLLLGMSLTIFVAAADGPFFGPTRCEAVFVAPADETCRLEGSWTVSATGRRSIVAQNLALERLREVVQLEVGIRLEQPPVDRQDLVRPMIAGCVDTAVEDARLYCDNGDALSDREFCYASFEDDSCWRGLGFEIDNRPNWKSLELGRTGICENMTDWMVQNGSTAVEQNECRLRCLQSAQVTCQEL